MDKPRGRPRSFDKADALDSALQLFWRHGYQAASMAELTAAMGLARPSLYAAYGDKEGLYVQSVQRYASRQLLPLLQALDAAADLRAGTEALLQAQATLCAQGGGCLVINGLADVGAPGTPPAVQQALAQVMADSEAALRARAQRARRQGQLAPGHTAAEFAAWLMLTMAGLAMRTRAGEPPAKLLRALQPALAAWCRAPGSSL